MRRPSIPYAILSTIAVICLLSGCLQQKMFDASKIERVSGSGAQYIDIDGDGASEVMMYSFEPVRIEGTTFITERQVAVAIRTQAEPEGAPARLNDADLLPIDALLEEFSLTSSDAQTKCGRTIGLVGVVCNDAETCAKLCGSNLGCKTPSTAYDDVLGGSMLTYVKDTGRLGSALLDSKRSLIRLKNATQTERTEFLSNTREMVNLVAEINANGLFSGGPVGLCTQSDFGAPFALEAAKKSGEFSIQNESYHYYVSVILRSSETTDASSISIMDRMPSVALPRLGDISSAQKANVTREGGKTLITIDLSKAPQKSYLFAYDFISTMPPEILVPAMSSPAVTTKTLDLAFLAPTNSIFTALMSATGNYYLSLGLAFGITIVVLYFIFTVLVFIFTCVNEIKNKPTFISVFRKAFGRTDVMWKTDLIVGIVMLAVAYYLSSAFAIQPTGAPKLQSVIGILLQGNWASIVSSALAFMGVITLYFAFDNLVKLRFLERAYGQAIKEDRDAYLSRVGTLKEKLHELEGVVEQYRNEGYDVGHEFEILSVISPQQVEAMAKDANQRNKVLVEENTMRLEAAIASLHEKKRSLESKYPQWKAEISRLLAEMGEVSFTALATIPLTMRSLVISRYLKENVSEGLMLEGETIKKKKMTPDRAVSELLSKGLAKGVVLLKADVVIATGFAEVNPTVSTVLSLKLRTYARSLGKSLMQHEPGSVVIAGNETTVVYTKGVAYESVLMLKRANAKEALDIWNSKVKMLETA